MIIEKDVIDSVCLFPTLRQVRVTLSHQFVEDSTQEVKAQTTKTLLHDVTSLTDRNALRLLLGVTKTDLIVANL